MIDTASFGDTVFVPQGDYTIEREIILKEGIILSGVKENLGDVVFIGNAYNPTISAYSHTTIKNLVIKAGTTGIYCDQDTTNITIEHNLIIQNEWGIDILADSVRLIGNTIAHNFPRGIMVHIDSNLTIDPNLAILQGVGNIFGFNGCDIEFYRITDPTSLESIDLTNIELSYNNVYGKVYRIWYDYGYTMIVENEIPAHDMGFFGLGNFSLDPYFVDPNREDYHLLSYSPCIDRGDPNMDYSSEPMPNGSRVNLGFYGNTPQASPSTIDTDGDGLYNYQEGIADLDGDGIPDYEDGDTATLPLPWGTETISLHLQNMSADSDRSLQFMETNTVLASDLPMNTQSHIFPFDAVTFSIDQITEGETVSITMFLPRSFCLLDASQYFALSSDNAWSSLSLVIDPDENAMTFTIADGDIGDRDGIENGRIEHLGGLIIPQSMSWENPDSCFISLLNPYSVEHSFFSVLKNYQHKVLKVKDIREQWTAFLNFVHFPLVVFILYSLAHKMILNKKSFLIFILFVLMHFFLSYGWADVRKPIEITSSPNPVGSGARAMGMGGAFIGIADDATAASWNPAGLKHLTRPEISWVEAYSTRRESYQFDMSPEATDEYQLDSWDVNYVSIVWPGRLFQRNFVISLNYQHLYDFSKELSSYHWHSSDNEYLDMEYQASYEQSGGLRALSPALAVTVMPRLTFGLTVNIWSNKLFTNEWIDTYHIDGAGEIGEDPQQVITHADVLEKYRFSGLNCNIGLLWDIGEFFSLGAVYKTHFTGKLDHTMLYYRREEYPEKTSAPQYSYDLRNDREKLSMPSSYGIGFAFHPLDVLVIDLDIYRTEWGEYEIITADGERINPITGYNRSEITVQPTHQVRIGAEYVYATGKCLIPTIRGGIFYDPEPAPNHPEDFYGVSFGLGITVRERNKDPYGEWDGKGRRNILRKQPKERKDIMSIDVAYQYRWGKKIEGETIKGENSPAEIDHHLVYISVIYYI
ncbi:MAG: choice-of-anchor U domain-containing protein [bacterium]